MSWNDAFHLHLKDDWKVFLRHKLETLCIKQNFEGKWSDW